MIKSHHKKQDVCYKRPNYRQPQWERAIKVYTVNQESKYLLIQCVPAVGASRELVERFALYGDIEEYRLLDEYPAEEFTEVYWIRYKKIACARFAKKKLDNRSFYGGLLHVCYAPEYESIDDTREKLLQRKTSVLRKCRQYQVENKTKEVVCDSGVTSNSACGDKPLAALTTVAELNNSFVRSSSDNLQSSVSQNTTDSIHNPAFFSIFSSVITPIVVDKTLPRVPTKNATLPAELQNLSAVEVYPTYFSDIEEANKDKQHRKLNNQKNISNTSIITETSTDSGVNIKLGSKRKVINWNKAVSDVPGPSCNKTYNNAPAGSYCYSQEPGAWDPFREQRRYKVSVPENGELDGTVSNIRQQLTNSVESSQIEQQSGNCPLQAVNATQLMVPTVIAKKRKADGRKRI